MEDDNCLDLTLGMTLGGPSTSSKGKNINSSDIRTEENDRGSKLIDDFKNFLEGGTQIPAPLIGSQKSEPSKPEENLFYDLSKSDGSANLNNGGVWVGNNNNNKSSEAEKVMTSEVGNKRKNNFSEKSLQKKQEKDNQTRTSHISITTDEGSTAENEDGADSEADGSTSKLVQHHEESSKKLSGSIGLSVGPNNVRGSGVSDSSAMDSQGQIRFTISSEKDFKMGNTPYGVTYPGQSVNILNVPANLPMTYGYPRAQVPTLNSGKTGVSGSHSLQFHPSYFGRGPPNSDKQNEGLKISQASWPVISDQPSELVKGDGKQAREEGPSSHAENGTKESNTVTPRPERFPSEYPSIRPGIAAELKFGGSGSSPNLPWVSTTGTGPHGRTISGVTYRYSATQIRIVCACHGSHLTPEEFVCHAVEEQPNQNPESGLESALNSNPAASAQS